MISVTSAQLYTWLAAFIWPLTRILGVIAIAPPFSNAMVPMRVKLMLGIFIAILISPNVPALPALDPMSLPGLLIVVQEMITGVAMGTVMSMTFSAVEMAGSIVSATMGLSFAAFFDPTSQGQTAVISQFYSLLATLIFLSLNGHLVLLATLSESFVTLPISAHPMGTEGVHQLVLWGSSIFRMGLQLSMPILGVLLLTNVALGVLSRAAQLLHQKAVRNGGVVLFLRRERTPRHGDSPSSPSKKYNAAMSEEPAETATTLPLTSEQERIRKAKEAWRSKAAAAFAKTPPWKKDFTTISSKVPGVASTRAAVSGVNATIVAPSGLSAEPNFTTPTRW